MDLQLWLLGFFWCLYWTGEGGRTSKNNHPVRIRRGDYGRSRVMQKSLTLFFINQFESAGDRLRVFFVPQKTSADTVALTLSAFIGWSWTKVQTARENFKSREFCFIQVGLERLKAEMCVDSWNLSTKSFRHFWSYCQQAFNQTWHMKVQSRVVDAIDCYLLDAPSSPEEPWYHSLSDIQPFSNRPSIPALLIISQ